MIWLENSKSTWSKKLPNIRKEIEMGSSKNILITALLFWTEKQLLVLGVFKEKTWYRQASRPPNKWKAEKTDFWCFRRFFWLIHAAETPQTRHFVRFCGVFAAAQNFDTKGAAKGAAKGKFWWKNWQKNAASCAAAKTPQNLTKCRVCGIFAARISGKKWKNHKIRLLCRWAATALPSIGIYWK